MVTQIIVRTDPNEFTTNGYLKVKEWGHDIKLRFLMAEDFRGKLVSVQWNVEDGEKHVVTADDEAWSQFEQVGERPEVIVPFSWIESLGLEGTVRLRIMFRFETFRQNPDWFAFMYLMNMEGDKNAPYYLTSDKKPGSDTDCCCNDDEEEDETDDSLVQP